MSVNHWLSLQFQTLRTQPDSLHHRTAHNIFPPLTHSRITYPPLPPTQTTPPLFRRRRGRKKEIKHNTNRISTIQPQLPPLIRLFLTSKIHSLIPSPSTRRSPASKLSSTTIRIDAFCFVETGGAVVEVGRVGFWVAFVAEAGAGGGAAAVRGLGGGFFAFGVGGC